MRYDVSNKKTKSTQEDGVNLGMHFSLPSPPPPLPHPYAKPLPRTVAYSVNKALRKRSRHSSSKPIESR